MKNDIPRTGRIGRFAKIIEKDVNQEAITRIMQDSDIYGSFRPEKKASWWMEAVKRLENEVGKKTAVEIMRACGRRCCSQGHRETARRLMNESRSIQDFLDRVSRYGVKEGELEYNFIDEKTIIGHFYRCFCGQVRSIKMPFRDTIYCNCSAEFHNQFFEAALGKTVKVEITRSIISGAESCEFVIHINS